MIKRGHGRRNVYDSYPGDVCWIPDQGGALGNDLGTQMQSGIKGKHSEDFIAENPCRDLRKAIGYD